MPVIGFHASHEQIHPRQLLTDVQHAPHAQWLQEYLDLGFDALYLHHVGRHQSGFIDAFGDLVGVSCVSLSSLTIRFWPTYA